MRRTDIAAVVPVFNPEPGLKPLCEALLARYETVVVVDDGSQENVEDFAALPDGVRLLKHPTNRGKGRAIKTALAWLKESAPAVKVAVFADGDGQHRVEDVEAVVEQAIATDRVVLGVRDFSKAGIPFRSRFGNILTSFLVRLIYRIPIHDTQTGLRAIPRRLFEMMLATAGERYEYEMRLFGRLSEQHEKLEQVSIETIYISNNRASHFHPVRDSFRVYRGLFGGSFFRFILSSLGGFVLDNIAFSLLLLLFTGLGLVQHFGVLLAIIPARLLSAFVNYQCNRVLVFGSTVRQRASLGRYALLAVLILFLSYLGTIAVSALFDVHGLAITAVKIVVEVLLFLMSYRLQQIWVFRATEETEFNAVAAGRRLLKMGGPVLPFAILLAVDVFINYRGQGWQFNWATFGWSLKCTLLTLMPVLALPLVLRRHARFVMPVLFVWILLVDVLELIAWNSFHMTVRGELLAIMMGSSWREVVAFLGVFVTFRAILLTLILLAVAVYCCRALWRHPGTYPRRALSSYVLAVILVILGIRLGYDAKDANSTYIVIDSIEQYSRYRKLADAVKNPDVSDVVVPERKVPLVVIVIGESATRDHWQLYGYARETTPAISARQDELIVFDDLLASWSHTQEVVQLLLTRGTLADSECVIATLPQILTKAGYESSLVSNQSRWGVFDSVVTLLFTGCDRTYYLDEDETRKLKDWNWDEDLMPRIEAELDRSSADKPLVMFIHLYGSHCPWRTQVPEASAYFSRNKKKPVPLVDYYDDTIRYTDGILGRILDKVSGLNREAVLLYLSDHGDSPDSGESRIIDDPALWRVPFFIWCSPDYRRAYPDRVAALERVKSAPLQSDRLFDGLLELMNVSIEGREKESFLHPAYDLTVPRKVMDGRRIVGPKWNGKMMPLPTFEPKEDLK